ncbi:hypothetical protein [Mongoliitalea daihaiensis]|uniref:hypothetical protein n=1 Tax=Mongoliitalea daihaiensis TaxID=2782006 RepID=UPI001F463118|nr:hypothetical protein [Mongoliitalea daihaiensis]UJP63661.1 hypothetical protein IPZ59_12535 [Mongoliitalea daihaiensis]
MVRLKKLFFKLFLIGLAFPFWISQKVPQTKQLPIIPEYQDSLYSGPKSMGKLKNSSIDEASGLVFSRNHAGIMYTHNDSGGKPIVFIIDTLGNSRGTITLKGVKNRDWEDISIGPGPVADVNYIYVGEIGDNQAKYNEIKIYRFPEPQNLDEALEVEPEVLILTYPDGPKDAETLMVDPLSQDIYVLSKRDSANILYKVSQKAFQQKQAVLQQVLKLPFTMSVAGDISTCGSKILVKNYLMVFFWERKPDQTIEEAMSKDPLILPYKPEPQGEAIAWHPTLDRYVTLSEKRFNIWPELYRYDKK